MSLIDILIVLVVVGVLLSLVQRAPFIHGTIKQTIVWIGLAGVVLWLLRVLLGIDMIRYLRQIAF